MTGKLIFAIAALALVFSYGMPTKVARADKKSCHALCSKTVPPREVAKCTQKCVAGGG